MRAWGLLMGLLVAGCTASSSDSASTSEPTTTTALVPTSTVSSTTIPASAGSTTSSTTTTTTALAPGALSIEAFPVPAGSRPHDVAPAADGGVWYTAQARGELGWLDPETGETRHIPLGAGSRPHGVIVDDQGTPWITDGGLNAIVSVVPGSDEVTIHPLPSDAAEANLNTAVFDNEGVLWFTGQAGIYGTFDPGTGAIEVFEAPRGTGPYGITATPAGDVFFASLAGSYVGSILTAGDVRVVEPPTANQGARRVWADSSGSIWVSEWDGGNVSRYQPETDNWDTWSLPGEDPAVYAVYVDESDIVWLSDFAANALVRFDPTSEEFTVYTLPHDPGDVRQIHGRAGEIWGAESAADHLVLVRTR